jgi:hypothetical protein
METAIDSSSVGKRFSAAVCVMIGMILSGSCSPGSSLAPGQVVGCYEPSVGPFLEDELSMLEALPRWVALDSARAGDAPVAPAYQVRLPAEYQHPRGYFRGWWEPLSADSIAIFWDKNGWSSELRLAVGESVLEGTAIPRLDVDDVPSHPRFPVMARRIPCDS